jgi:hypothetical protein
MDAHLRIFADFALRALLVAGIIGAAVHSVINAGPASQRIKAPGLQKAQTIGKHRKFPQRIFGYFCLKNLPSYPC